MTDPNASNASAAYALLAGLFDDESMTAAGAEPGEAADAFGRARMTDEKRAVARLVCPAGLLERLGRDGRAVMPGTYATSGYREMAGPGMTDPWEIAAVAGDEGPGAAADAALAFNAAHEAEDAGLARVSTIAVAVRAPADVEAALDEIPDTFRVRVAIPAEAWAGGDARGFVAAIASEDGASGWIGFAERSPSDAARRGLAALLGQASAAGLGLFVSIGAAPPARARAVATAAAFARAADAEHLAAILDRVELEPSAARLDAGGLAFGEDHAGAHEIARARERLLLGIGASDPLAAAAAMPSA